jgi:hypothetical protein
MHLSAEDNAGNKEGQPEEPEIAIYVPVRPINNIVFTDINATNATIDDIERTNLDDVVIAIDELRTGMWIQDNSTLGDVPVWLTAEQWKNTKITPLIPATDYEFRAHARGMEGEVVSGTNTTTIRTSEAQVPVCGGAEVRINDLIVQDGDNIRCEADTFIELGGGTVVVNAGARGEFIAPTIRVIPDTSIERGGYLHISTVGSEDLALITSKTTLTVAEGGSATFGVKLSAQPNGNTTVSLSRAAGDSSLSVSPSTLTFTTSNWSSYQTVTVSASEDSDTTNGTATIRASSTATTPSYTDLTATESDNDDLSLIASKTTLTVAEGGSATFGVKLSAQPSGNTTVTLSRAAGDSSLTVSPSTLTFTTSNWSSYQTVTVSASEDSDTTSGTATIRASSTATTPSYKDLTATESDNDVVTPGSLSASATSYNRVSLSWVDKSSNETKYRVKRKRVWPLPESGLTTIATLGVNASSYVDTTVSQNANYEYSVCAQNSYSISCTAQLSLWTPVMPDILAENFDTNPFSSSTWYGPDLIFQAGVADACGGADGYIYRQYDGDRILTYMLGFPGIPETQYVDLSFWYRNGRYGSITAEVALNGAWVPIYTAGGSEVNGVAEWRQASVLVPQGSGGLRFVFSTSQGYNNSTTMRRLDCIELPGQRL